MTHIERENELSTSAQSLPGHYGRVSEYVMRNEEYENAYSEAREILYNRGNQVGAPRLGVDSIRRCSVDGVLLSDHDVLKEAWGARLAEEILVEIADRESTNKLLPEGNLFWRQYPAATRHKLKILIDQQIAAQKWISNTPPNLRHC